MNASAVWYMMIYHTADAFRISNHLRTVTTSSRASLIRVFSDIEKTVLFSDLADLTAESENRKLFQRQRWLELGLLYLIYFGSHRKNLYHTWKFCSVLKIPSYWISQILIGNVYNTNWRSRNMPENKSLSHEKEPMAMCHNYINQHAHYA